MGFGFFDSIFKFKRLMDELDRKIKSIRDNPVKDQNDLKNLKKDSDEIIKFVIRLKDRIKDILKDDKEIKLVKLDEMRNILIRKQQVLDGEIRSKVKEVNPGFDCVHPIRDCLVTIEKKLKEMAEIKMYGAGFGKEALRVEEKSEDGTIVGYSIILLQPRRIIHAGRAVKETTMCSAWEINHFFIYPQFRRKGYGKKLLIHVLREAFNKWGKTDYVYINRSASEGYGDFLRKMGFKPHATNLFEMVRHKVDPSKLELLKELSQNTPEGEELLLEWKSVVKLIS